MLDINIPSSEDMTNLSGTLISAVLFIKNKAGTALGATDITFIKPEFSNCPFGKLICLWMVSA